jgi:hypothetical protein
MKQNRRRIVVIASCLGLGAALVAGVGAVARADADDSLEGAWKLAVHVDSPPGIGTFPDLMTFSAGGGVVSSRPAYLLGLPAGPALETPGHGAWASIGHRTFAVTVENIIQGAPDNPILDGAVFAGEKIQWNAERHADGTLGGRWISTFTDPSGAVLFQASGTIDATRIVPEPLP